jgi:SAM-dependent methyltransferase
MSGSEPTAGGEPRRCCRFCGAPLSHTFIDLGMSPLCESYLTGDQLREMEPFYPLRAFVCERCLLVQLEAHVSGEEIFGREYAYFSSYSDTWLEHCRAYVETITERLALGKGSRVIEIASNDGYLLRNFVARGIPSLGIEPAPNVAEAAVAKGIPTIVKFFGTPLARELAGEGWSADLLIANNVMAHVPDLNDFVRGMKLILAERGVITIELQHLLRLIEGNQFDTIYQEHYCYFSLLAAQGVLSEHGLSIFDVEELPTHGGSIRIYARHADGRPPLPSVPGLVEQEEAKGLRRLETYSAFGEKVAKTKFQLLEFLIRARREGRSVAGYGAPGKGNTLLNYCGIRTDLLDYVVDRNPYKQGRYLPGTHIPIFPPEKIAESKPDYVLILPWNLKEEIMEQLKYVRQWGARFVIPIPELQVC